MELNVKDRPMLHHGDTATGVGYAPGNETHPHPLHSNINIEVPTNDH